MGVEGGKTVRENLPTPSTAPARAPKRSSFGVVTKRGVRMEAQASAGEGEGREKRRGPRKPFFWTDFHQNSPWRKTCVARRALPCAGRTPTRPTVSLREKFSSSRERKGAKQGWVCFRIFENTTSARFWAPPTSPGSDRWRYLTLSERLGWGPKKFRELSGSVQRVVQEMGVWTMG
jgi:hypothetical protein